MTPARKLRRSPGLLWALALALIVCGRPAVAQSAPDRDNRVVLRVNDRIATLYDYQRAVAAQIDEIRRAPGLTEREREEQLREAGRLVMKALFEELLLMSRADQLAIVVDESDVEEQIRSTWEQFGIESQEQFEQALGQSGMREEDFRQQMRKMLRANAVRGREVAARVTVEEEDLRRSYRENQDRFRIPERARFEEVVLLEGVVSPEEMAPLAAEARAGLLAGGTAEAVAEELGDGATAVDVGWVSRGDLAPALDSVAWDLEAGGVSEPVDARGGLHVLKMLERTPASVQPFDDVREAIERNERGRRFSEEMELYLEELAEAAYIVERLPEEAEGYRPVAAPSLDAEALGLFAPFAPVGESELPAEPGVESSDERDAEPAPDAEQQR